MLGTEIYHEGDTIRTMARASSLAPLTASALWGGMYVVSKWGFAAIPRSPSRFAASFSAG